MAADDFNPTDLYTALDVLRTAGIYADTDPEKVRVPGVWARLDNIDLDQLDGLTINTTLHVIVPDNDRAVEETAAHFNLVKNTLRAGGLDVYGPVTPVSVQLPGSQTPLPGLACTLPIHTCTN